MSTDRTTELINYVSAMAREIGEMRQEMNSRFDRVDAEVRAINTRLDRLEARILEERADRRDLDERVRVLESK